jgi:hypothetical protein
MSHLYSELDLRRLKGQALKDVWHGMIGKPAGLKNTTGLKNSEEIIQAILEKQSEEIVLSPVEMPPKPKEVKVKEVKVKEVKVKEVKVKEVKVKEVKVNQKKQVEVKGSSLLAVESAEAPLEVVDVVRIAVVKRVVEGVEYYIEKETNKVFSVKDGQPQGVWDSDSNSIQEA